MIQASSHSAIAIWSSTIAYASLFWISFGILQRSTASSAFPLFLKHPKQPHSLAYQIQVESTIGLLIFLGSVIFLFLLYL
jgi:hypothetical protein